MFTVAYLNIAFHYFLLGTYPKSKYGEITYEK